MLTIEAENKTVDSAISDRKNHTNEPLLRSEVTMRILIADDHDLFRESIGAVLENNSRSEVTLAADLHTALEVVHKDGPFDVVFLDYDMPGMNGLDGLREMIAANKSMPVALLSGAIPDEMASKALEIGAAGFVPKTISMRSLISATNFIASGEIYAPFELFQRKNDSTQAGLTPRETDVLIGLCNGQSNKEIARDLSVQEVTIKLHVRTLCRKLDARNRTHAAMIARNRGLV